MKLLFLSILFLLSIQAGYSFNGCDEGCHQETPLSDFMIEDCAIRKELQSNLDEKFCTSGAISFEQPLANGSDIQFNGRVYNTEGKCGQTAFSNLLRMTCGFSLSPAEVDHYYMNVFYEDIHWYEYPLGLLTFLAKRKLTDLFPGSLPSSISGGLNKFFDENSFCGSKRWSSKAAKNSNQFINNIENGLMAGGKKLSTAITRYNGEKVFNSPVAVLIKAPNSDSLHWITVTDLQNDLDNKCVVTFSSYGDEYKTSCRQLSEWAFNIQRSYSSIASPLTYVTVQLDN